MVQQTTAKAAAVEGIPYGTAIKIWQKFKATKSTKNHPRTGRPRKNTTQDECHIIRTATKSCRMTLRDISNQSTSNSSVETVCQCRQDNSYLLGFSGSDLIQPIPVVGKRSSQI
ncbi:hypothetical protein FA15DRAFT_296486 [Coprinopsis marcescibilis]|uniref:Uncharacterized protein n=1 Tax=Coprinopsis marcescibilis TaxID=230819 RepID=A0A5C3KD64_COPMA|nr:hypothetical protein FA15DRAFT_296486 [Coprinopsis marcescibilis]